jgi:predicted ATPase/DNA-binding SARP family transcriptional activator
MLRISLLGVLRLEVDGVDVPAPSSRRARLLLAMLAMERRSHSREALSAWLWPDVLDERARVSLRTALAQLRAALGPDAGCFLHATRECVALAGPQMVWTDVDELERLLEERRVQEALGLRGAEFLVGLEDDWVYECRDALRRRLYDALRLAAGEAEAAGELQTALALTRRVVALDVLPEEPQRDLIRLLASAGDRAAALTVYDKLSVRLREQLGTVASAATRELAAAIRAGAMPSGADAKRQPDGNGGVTAGPTPPGGATRMAPAPARLPARTAGLLGRDTDARMLVDLLRRDDVRLVTVTGIGGVGKTSLALEVAGRLAAELADGATFVDLAALSDPRGLPDAVLHALGCTPELGIGATETLCRVAAAMEQLLVLDNFEHLLSAALLVVELLDAAPGLKLMVTSRSPLHLRGEHCYPLEPLALPPTPDPVAVAAAPATALFIARARACDPAFCVATAGAQAIATVCARLDGLPLAIELAATRCHVLSPREIARRLDCALPALGSGARDAPDRQRTLRATLDWSYDLLSSDDQLAFLRLSVFAGGFTLEAVADICHGGDIDHALETLARLVENSLVAAEPSAHGTRYRLLETVRQHAAERLSASGDEERVKRRHAGHYLALAEQGEPHLTGRDQAAWLDRLEMEHDNLCAAVESSLAHGDATTSLRLAAALVWFWYLRGYFSEGQELLTRILAADGQASASASARAKALRASGMLALLQCEYERAKKLLGESLAFDREIGDKRGTACSLQMLGSVAREQADYPAALAFHEESLALCHELDDRHGIARSLNHLAFVAWITGEHEKATALSTAARDRYRRLGDKERIAWSTLHLAATGLHRGDVASATALSEHALNLSREIGYKEGIGWSLNFLGVAAHRRGDRASASTHLKESLRAHAELGDRWRAAALLDALAGLACDGGDLQRSARLYGAGDALRDAIGVEVPACERSCRERQVAAVRAASRPEDFVRASSEGHSMSTEDAVAEALS